MVVRIARDEVQHLVIDGALLVEVLPKGEYDDEHLPDAVHLPLKSLTARRRRCWIEGGQSSSIASTPSEI